MNVRNYILIARPDNAIKNLFVLPGIIFATFLGNYTFNENILSIVIGLTATIFIASANYIINEWLDADSDKYHPTKKNRPSATGNVTKFIVYVEYGLLVILGLGLSISISPGFFLAAFALLFMGIVYNVRPLRTKDKVYLDVISESVNNPIRFILGWYIVIPNLTLPPSSIIIAYWMAGAFLMAIKRYAEFRFIGNPQTAGLYRRSFLFYTEEKLLISSFFYALCSAFFLGIFLMKYKIELIISFPFFAFLFTLYFRIGLKPNSMAQKPESFYKEKYLLIYCIIFIVLLLLLLKINIPILKVFLEYPFGVMR